jgi:hypothetical protein
MRKNIILIGSIILNITLAFLLIRALAYQKNNTSHTYSETNCPDSINVWTINAPWLKTAKPLGISEGKRSYLQFFNNPFCFSSKDSVCVFIDEKCVYKSNFKMYDSLYISTTLTNKTVRPQMYITKNTKTYTFLNKDNSNFYLDHKDNLLSVLFTPMNGRDNGAYMISNTK